jgi:lipase
VSSRQITEHRVAGLHVVEWPSDGPTVIALPGLGATARMWTALADDAPGVRLIAPDLRGRGGSVRVTGEPGLRRHARDVAAIAAELDLHDAVLVGHSMGAFLAPVVGQEMGDRVSRMVLIDGGLPPKLPFFFRPALVRMSFRREGRKAGGPWLDVETYVNTLLAEPLAGRPDLIARVIEWSAHDLAGPVAALTPLVDVERTITDAVDSFFGPDAKAIRTLAVPAHAILASHSKNDRDKPFIADSVVSRWTAELPHLTVERVEGNHMTVLFGPEVVNAVAGS